MKERRKRLLGEFRSYDIVKVDGRWGVICKSFGYGIEPSSESIVDFWEGGREAIPKDTPATGLPSK